MKRSDRKLGQNSSKRQFSDARQLGCVFQDTERRRSLFSGRADMPKPIQRVKFHKGYRTSYQNSRPKSLAPVTFVQVNLMSVAPTLPKFEDRSQEETE